MIPPPMHSFFVSYVRMCHHFFFCSTEETITIWRFRCRYCHHWLRAYTVWSLFTSVVVTVVISVIFGKGEIGRRRNPSDRSWWACAYTVYGVCFYSTRDINIRWVLLFCCVLFLALSEGILWVYILSMIMGDEMVWGQHCRATSEANLPLRLWPFRRFAECRRDTLLAAELRCLRFSGATNGL